jgi:hypothetical protein
MNVGFRPRLKARPSLYDLIRSQSSDHLAILSPSRFVDIAELPALPHSLPSTPIVEKPQARIRIPISMPPKKQVAKDDDGEDQYGKY